MEYDLYILSMPAHLLPMPNLEEYLLDILKDYQIFFFFFGGGGGPVFCKFVR